MCHLNLEPRLHHNHIALDRSVVAAPDVLAGIPRGISHWMGYGVSESTVCRSTIQKIENVLLQSKQFHLPGKKVADAGYQGLAKLHPNSQTPAKKGGCGYCHQFIDS